MPVLNDWNPTDETLRRWAYDEDLELAEQDEDLVLHSAGYVPLLLEFAADPACSKQAYCLGILTYFAQLQVLHRQVGSVEAIAHAYQAYAGPRPPALVAWWAAFEGLRQRLVAPRPLDPVEARQLAFDLTTAGTARTFTPGRTLANGYREYLASYGSFRLYLYLNPQTGYWQLAHYEPLEVNNFQGEFFPNA